MRCFYAIYVLYDLSSTSGYDLYQIGGFEIMFFDWFIPIWGIFFDSMLTSWCFIPVLCLGFISCIPGLLKTCIYGRN